MANRLAINRPGFSSPILSEALIHNGLVYTSGKIGVDAKTGVLVSDDVSEQTKAVLGLLESVLHEAGSGLGRILKCNIYLTNINDFVAMNAKNADTAMDIATIPNPKPARVCVTVSELGKGAKVEIDCIAIVEKAL
ncbi:Endoribonuclease L-PSP/chorismate mutase-like protein [Fusarium sp. MPI-SDFR-AT-0072]|nr:Endoribonuclease L-PSP/chorismate mutase-like protein [Fusarium sp. MPI-SDFR-AT-0072]